MQRRIKGFVLLVTGLFLLRQLLAGTIYFYINERFTPLTWLAVAGFLLVGGSYLIRPSEDGHGHEHDGHSHGELSWWGVLIVIAPVLLGLLVPPKPLGAAALGNRELNVGGLSSLSPPSSDDRMGLVAGEKNILDWLYGFQANPDPSAFAGQEATVVGFVYRDERFAGTQFMVSRFTLNCCVADASPVGLVVQWDGAEGLPADSWVKVTGIFEEGEFAGKKIPLLIAGNVQPIDQPAQPYLYP